MLVCYNVCPVCVARPVLRRMRNSSDGHEECRDGLETKSKDSSDCASVHKKFFGKRFKALPKPAGPGGSMPVGTSEGYLGKA